MATMWMLSASFLLVLAGLTAGADDITAQLQSLAEDLSVVWDEGTKMEANTRLVEPPVTPNRIIDVMINRVVMVLRKQNWDTQKSFPNLSGNVPLNRPGSAIRVEITNGFYRNLGTIRRGRAATIDVNRHLMSGSLIFNRLETRANYKVSTPRIDQAPASTAAGSVSSQAYKYFVDYSFMVDTNGLPVGINYWRARSGQMNYQGATGLNGNSYKPVFDSVLKDAMRSLMDRMISRELYNIVNNHIIGKMELEA